MFRGERGLQRILDLVETLQAPAIDGEVTAQLETLLFALEPIATERDLTEVRPVALEHQRHAFLWILAVRYPHGIAGAELREIVDDFELNPRALRRTQKPRRVDAVPFLDAPLHTSLATLQMVLGLRVLLDLHEALQGFQEFRALAFHVGSSPRRIANRVIAVSTQRSCQSRTRVL